MRAGISRGKRLLLSQRTNPAGREAVHQYGIIVQYAAPVVPTLYEIHLRRISKRRAETHDLGATRSETIRATSDQVGQTLSSVQPSGQQWPISQVPHDTLLPQLSVALPHVALPQGFAAGVQPQVPAAVPPPQVCGDVQTVQAPAFPHAVFAVPAAHVVPEQQPPLHAVVLVEPHAVPQVDVVVLQARSAGQSAPALAAAHPQWAAPLITTQEEPAAFPAHETAVPHSPHALQVSTPLVVLLHWVAPGVQTGAAVHEHVPQPQLALHTCVP
jgi:hypothetical protein